METGRGGGLGAGAGTQPAECLRQVREGYSLRLGLALPVWVLWPRGESDGLSVAGVVPRAFLEPQG